MPFPVLHSFAGYSLYRVSVREDDRDWKFASLCMVLANLADLDFLPGLAFGRSELFHRGFTHSLGAALFCGLVVAGLLSFFSKGYSFTKSFLISVAAYSSHILLDSLNGPGTAMPVFWPLSLRRFAMPFSWSLGSRTVRTAGDVHDFVGGLLSPAAWHRIFFELSLVLFVGLWVQTLRQANASIERREIATRVVFGYLLFVVCVMLQ